MTKFWNIPVSLPVGPGKGGPHFQFLFISDVPSDLVQRIIGELIVRPHENS